MLSSRAIEFTYRAERPLRLSLLPLHFVPCPRSWNFAPAATSRSSWLRDPLLVHVHLRPFQRWILIYSRHVEAVLLAMIKGWLPRSFRYLIKHSLYDFAQAYGDFFSSLVRQEFRVDARDVWQTCLRKFDNVEIRFLRDVYRGVIESTVSHCVIVKKFVSSLFRLSNMAFLYVHFRINSV